MTVLPSNLALVADDLAQATLRDVRRSVKRRRIAAFAIAFALLALTASAAIATGWLSDKTPTAKAVRALDEGTKAGEARVLMTGLGAAGRTLTAVTTASGSVCLTLTGFSKQCVPTLLAKQQIAWFVWWSQTGPTVVWGVARDGVTGVDAISADGTRTEARFASQGFFVELANGPPTSLVAHLSNGSTVTRPLSRCPLTTPNCTP